jgi:hypothetical protein
MVAFRSNINKFLSSLYLISWIFIGNFVFLNLFLAILLDGFTSNEVEHDLNGDIEEKKEHDLQYLGMIEENLRNSLENFELK